MDDFKNEGLVASGSWPFQVNILKSEEKPVASVIPVEGATGWADTTMMHVDSENPNCSYLWMEHTLASNLQSDLSVVCSGRILPFSLRAPTAGECRLQLAVPPTGWTISRR